MSKKNQVQEIDHLTAWKMINESKKVVLFCGSGVSIFPPSSMPSGNDLRSSCVEKISLQFKQFNLEDPGIDGLKELPLEFLIGLSTSEKTRDEINKIFENIAKYYQKIKPNNLHYLLSALLLSHSQCSLITTNYDMGFQRAINGILKTKNIESIQEVKIFSIKNFEDDCFNANNAIYKIHGCAKEDSPENLVLTTKQEAFGLPRRFLSFLPDLFKNSLVVFMGYSASEPDCLEALMGIQKFSTIWVDRDVKTMNDNFRANIILSSANRGYFLSDLSPFINNAISYFPSKLLSNEIQKELLNNSRNYANQNSCIYKNEGIFLYKELVNQVDAKHVLQVVIQGFLHLRKFDTVDKLLSLYQNIPDYSEYFWFLGKASITRDLNNDWKKARELFFEASMLPNLMEYQITNAEVEYLGLENLLYKYNKRKLKGVENKVHNLIDYVEKRLKNCDKTEKVDWQNILGTCQKNLIQNLEYQNIKSITEIKARISLCRKAINNFYNTGDINKRIEAERFLSRVYLQAYYVEKKKKYLQQAFKICHKSVSLFNLMSIEMGIINSLRQYISILIMMKNYSEASDMVDKLNERLEKSPDELSKIKVLILQISLSQKQRKSFQCLKYIMLLIKRLITLLDKRVKSELFKN